MDESVPDTPVANRKVMHTPPNGDHETIAALPAAPVPAPGAAISPSQRLTQPTQVINHPNGENNASVVQVAASSPPAHSPSPARPVQKGGILSSAMAPNGTRFCPPHSAAPTKGAPVVNLEDDGPTYRGGSSDDDIQVIQSTDIKPSMFTRSPEKDRVMESPPAGGNGPMDRFKQVTSSAVYSPELQPKRPATQMDPAPPGPTKKPRQDGPARAQPAQISLDDIDDYLSRLKVERIMKIMGKPIGEVVEALMARNWDFNSATRYLDQPVDQRVEERRDPSDDELSADRRPSAAPAKQRIKAQGTIQNKWSSSMRIPGASNQKPPVQEEAKHRRRFVRGPKTRSPSPVHESTPPKGRKQPTPTRSESPEAPLVISDDEGVEPAGENQLDLRVLKFFNSCTPPELADLAAETEEIANFVISHRPFESLDAVRVVPAPPNDHPAKPKGSRGRKNPKPIGDKIVDKCEDMLTGYEAVDSLVAECESLGQPIAREMRKWGIDIFGKRGEFELVSLDREHDSGIGTPTSHRTSQRSDEESDGPAPARKNRFIGQPEIMCQELKMKDFQIVGINWLALLFEKELSCILADDMGLGKTCQVIAFLAHLYEKNIKGPHLIVVPSSTIENWLREFQKFCPTLSVMPYYAGQAERAEIREMIEENRDNINVVITTYTIAKAKTDAHFLRKMNFCVCVYDEGHMLKSSKSVLYEKLIRIPARFRLLLTGTPLQNNLQELASLLGFILPQVFQERKEDLHHIFANKATTANESHTHSTLLSVQRIDRAKSMLKPFVLRRKKHQVIDLPPKFSHVEYCQLHESQRGIYDHEKDEVRKLLADRAAGKRTGNKSANILMKLRQAAIHPLLYRRNYSDDTLRRMAKACLKEPQFQHSNPSVIFEELTFYSDLECHDLCVKYPGALGKFALQEAEWMDSGKVDKLCELLSRFKEDGDRTLVFSQFTKVMDILERVLENQQIGFVRLDGQTSVEDRQSILDAFHERTEIPVFLLSTKAGGAGINLACANKVIIFDSSFNPQEDVQAENRAHRVGQSRSVEVIRLVTRETIEEQIHALGQTKLALDQAVVGEDAGDSKKGEEMGMKVVEDMVAADLGDKPT